MAERLLRTEQFGLTHTGYRHAIGKRVFVYHILKVNPGRSLCGERTPYQWRLGALGGLSSKGILCHDCRIYKGA